MSETDSREKLRKFRVSQIISKRDLEDGYVNMTANYVDMFRWMLDEMRQQGFQVVLDTVRFHEYDEDSFDGRVIELTAMGGDEEA